MLERIKCHSEHNKCKTYFTITGDFEPEQITEILELTPFETWTKGDKKRIGKGNYTFSRWSYGLCEDYEVETDIMLSKTLASLFGKVQLLQNIKKTFQNVEYTLEVVPIIRYDESTPTLAPTMEIMKWCVETGTEIDIDLYVSTPDGCIDEYTIL